MLPPLKKKPSCCLCASTLQHLTKKRKEEKRKEKKRKEEKRKEKKRKEKKRKEKKRKEKKRKEKKRKEKKRKDYTFRRQFNEKPVLYRAAQGLKDVEVVLARPVVPPVSFRLQCISAVVL